MTNNDGVYEFSNPALMTFPHLFKPEAVVVNGKPTGEPKYSANFVLDPEGEDFGEIQDIAVRLAEEKLGAGVDLQSLAWPWKSGTVLADDRARKCKADGKEPDGEFLRGKVVLTARSKHAPALGSVATGRLVQLSGDARAAAEEKFYFGAEVLAAVKLAAHAVGNNKPGVNAYLTMVVETGKGKRLGGEKSVLNVSKWSNMAGHVGHATGIDPTQRRRPPV